MIATALIVGISPTQRNAIVKKIESMRIFSHIRHSASTFETLNCLRNHPVDLIFCDLEKPTAERLVWLKELRKRDSWKDIPVFAFTDGKDLTERILPLELGASDCLSHDTSAEEIAARVRIHLRNKERIEQLLRAKCDLARLALTDPLTGLYNRAFFDAALESEIARSERTDKPFSLLMIDLDHFKQINDTYGHQSGDMVLQAVATVLGNTVRKSDTVCRYGGEEFAIILPSTPVPHAYVLAGRIHKKIAGMAKSHQQFQDPITVSIGISCAPGSTSIHPKEIIEQADFALYAAKRGGRNRTEIFTFDERAFTAPSLFSGTISHFAHA